MWCAVKASSGGPRQGSLRPAWANGEHHFNQGYEERCYLKTPRINKLSIQFGKTEKKKRVDQRKKKEIMTEKIK